MKEELWPIKISVVIPLYNKEKRISDCINSVIAQTSAATEIIIVDDGSTDDSLEIAKRSLKNHNGNVKIISQKNSGASSARNTGVEASESNLIAFLDADDEWSPIYIEKMKRLIIDFPSASLYGCSHAIRTKNHKGRIKVKKKRPWVIKGKRGIVSNFFLSSLGGSIVNCSKTIVRKESLISVDGFPCGIPAGEDLIVWMKLASKYEVAYEDATLVTINLEKDHSRDGRIGAVPYPLTYYSSLVYEGIDFSTKLYLLKIAAAHAISESKVNSTRKNKGLFDSINKIFPVFGPILLGISNVTFAYGTIKKGVEKFIPRKPLL